MVWWFSILFCFVCFELPVSCNLTLGFDLWLFDNLGVLVFRVTFLGYRVFDLVGLFDFISSYLYCFVVCDLADLVVLVVFWFALPVILGYVLDFWIA